MQPLKNMRTPSPKHRDRDREGVLAGRWQLSSLQRALASCDVPQPQAEVTGVPASRRTRSAIGAINGGPHGMLASGVLKLSKSGPPALKLRASSMDSVSACSSRPFYSSTPKRTVSGRFSDQTSRTAAKVSRRKRLRLSKLSP